MTSEPATKARSTKREKQRARVFSEDIPHASNSLQELLLEGPIDLVAQAADEKHPRCSSAGEAVLPDVRQDHVLDTTRPALPQQIFEQRELARTQLDRRPPRVTFRESRSSVKSATVSDVGSGVRLARRTSACTRASNSANANGFVR